ncbi:unnamed protein product [Effrenium voratum]|nr:unnamed protein product [Effrenium voratum]
MGSKSSSSSEKVKEKKKAKKEKTKKKEKGKKDKKDKKQKKKDKKAKEEELERQSFEAALAAAAAERSKLEEAAPEQTGEGSKRRGSEKRGKLPKLEKEDLKETDKAMPAVPQKGSGETAVLDAFSYDPTKKTSGDYSKPDALSLANSGLDIQRAIYQHDRSQYTPEQLRRVDELTRMSFFICK